jgi:hypothetical protein
VCLNLDGYYDGWMHADIHHMEHVQISKGKILYCPVRDSVSTPVWRLAITVVLAYANTKVRLPNCDSPDYPWAHGTH